MKPTFNYYFPAIALCGKCGRSLENFPYVTETKDGGQTWESPVCYPSCSTPAEGGISQDDFETALGEALAEVRELMISRHAKYGPGNIARHGELGLLVRLGDKYERLDNNREDLADESVDDTVDDIIGYGVIWKLWRQGRWPGQQSASSSTE